MQYQNCQKIRVSTERLAGETDVGEACLKLDQKSRACTKDSKEIMQRGKVYKAYPLGNHQGSAVENASPFVLGMFVTFFSFFLYEK